MLCHPYIPKDLYVSSLVPKRERERERERERAGEKGRWPSVCSCPTDYVFLFVCRTVLYGCVKS